MTAAAGALFLHRAGQDAPLEPHPLSATDYYATAVEAELVFVIDQRGEVTGLVFKQNGRELTAPKLR